MKNLLLIALLTLLFAPNYVNSDIIENNSPVPFKPQEIDPSRPYFDDVPKEGEYELKSTAEARTRYHTEMIKDLEKRNDKLELRIMILEMQLESMRDGSNIPNRERNESDI